MRAEAVDELLTLAAVKLAQPGQLSDISDAYSRLEPKSVATFNLKKDIRSALVRLEEFGLVYL